MTTLKATTPDNKTFIAATEAQLMETLQAAGYKDIVLQYPLPVATVVKVEIQP